MSDTTDPAVKDEVVAQETTVPESAPVETKAPEVADSFDEVWDDDESPAPKKDEPKAETAAPVDTPTDTAEETEPAADETKADEQPRGKADERKQQLNTEIRDLVAQRNALKAEVETQNAQTYQPQSVEDLVADGMDETRAMVESMRQEQEIDKFNSRIVDAQLTLESESNKVLNDFPIFNPTSEQYRPEVAAKAAQLLQANLIIDQNTNQVIGSNVSPYQLYETIAAASQASAVQGQIEGQRATEQMLANADSVGNAAPPKTKADPILEIWAD